MKKLKKHEGHRCFQWHVDILAHHRDMELVHRIGKYTKNMQISEKIEKHEGHRCFQWHVDILAHRDMELVHKNTQKNIQENTKEYKNAKCKIPRPPLAASSDMLTS